MKTQEDLEIKCDCGINPDCQTIIKFDEDSSMMTIWDQKKDRLLDFYFNADTCKSLIKKLKELRKFCKKQR